MRMMAVSALRHVLRSCPSVGVRTKSTFASSPIQISVSDDGTTIVCWHPEQRLRYEDTKPMPVIEHKFHDSVLRPEVHAEVESVMKKRDLSDEDLIRLTYTPRAVWGRHARREKRHVLHPNPPIDRIGV